MQQLLLEIMTFLFILTFFYKKKSDYSTLVLAVSVEDQLQLLTNNYLDSGDREDTAVPNRKDDLVVAWLQLYEHPI